MKKILFVILLMILVTRGFGQFGSAHIFWPSSVNLFGLYEISFTLPTTYTNPYDPNVISAYAVFTGPDNSTYTVNAFYYEDYTFQQHAEGYEIATHHAENDGWRIRFTPNSVGTWSFVVNAFDTNGAVQVSFMNLSHTFTCNSVTDADGFISKANTRYLKRDVVRDSQRKYRSFFPIGPNVGWYDNLNYNNEKPLGIYQYKGYIDSLYNNCNYMRVFLTRYHHLSLYGPEYTETENGNPKVYFDSIINQKDSAELDYIITYALQHDIAIMPCIFNCEDFQIGSQNSSSPNIWENNPYNTVLNLSNPCQFFTNRTANRITKNLIRYIVSRWGYATNVMAWELWNEVNHVFDNDNGYDGVEQDVVIWHEGMAYYMRSIDPFQHCISTSMGSNGINYQTLYANLYDELDFVQNHRYENIQNAASRKQLSYRLYLRVKEGQTQYKTKPFFQGEFGFSQNHDAPLYAEKDPWGFDLHNSLWSSLFSTSMGPASFWWWPYTNSCGLYHHFMPLLNFCRNLPIPSDSFSSDLTGHETGHKLVFPNNLETYYMINETQDTIYGWSQDTAFAYQSLRWLTDSVRMKNDTIYIIDTVYINNSMHIDTVQNILHGLLFVDDAVLDPGGYVYTMNPSKRPAPSSNSNTIILPITNQPVGSRYQVKWYNSETGYVLNTAITEYVSVYQNAQGEKFVSFQFPSQVRNLRQNTINNKYGDAVFVLVLNNPIELNE